MLPFVAFCFLRTTDTIQFERGGEGGCAISTPLRDDPDASLSAAYKMEATVFIDRDNSSSSLQSVDILRTNDHAHDLYRRAHFIDELAGVLRSPVYVLVVLGQAAYTVFVYVPLLDGFFSIGSFLPALFTQRIFFPRMYRP